ncbi:hypothetical protein [Streptomyces orinoci]|uniref:Uncharacterized protein n=1 Tax=Streptomyces orinoci TaxID=67339 RepID=A0ABV3JVS4_STRON|nr:hypothetical protein [Streptomyces orinoci]
MPKPVKHITPVLSEPESLADLRRDCARMAPHWAGHGPSAPRGPLPEGTSLSLIRGVVVPPRSARLLDGMSEYGD